MKKLGIAIAKGLGLTLSLVLFAAFIVLSLFLGYMLISTFTGISILFGAVALISSLVFYYKPQIFDNILEEIGFK